MSVIRVEVFDFILDNEEVYTFRSNQEIPQLYTDDGYRWDEILGKHRRK